MCSINSRKVKHITSQLFLFIDKLNNTYPVIDSQKIVYSNVRKKH